MSSTSRAFAVSAFMAISLSVVSCRSKQQPPSPQESSSTTLPTGWLDWNTPDRVDSLARRCASIARITNRVALAGDSVRIDPEVERLTAFKGRYLTEPLPFSFAPAGSGGARIVQQIQNGWLVGYSNGEFGGSLWFVGPDGKQSTKLLDENVKAIRSFWGDAVVFTSAEGQGFPGGAIYDIGANGKIKNHIDFESAPEAFTLDSNQGFLIAVDSGVYRVGSDWKMKQVYKRNLSGFSPASVAIKGNGTIYIGMRFFVLMLTPDQSGYREQWLVPTGCRDFHVEQFNCVCDRPPPPHFPDMRPAIGP